MLSYNEICQNFGFLARAMYFEPAFYIRVAVSECKNNYSLAAI
jgi:hypothetical protein